MDGCTKRLVDDQAKSETSVGKPIDVCRCAYDALTADWDAYIAEVTASLNELGADETTPGLGALDHERHGVVHRRCFELRVRVGVGHTRNSSSANPCPTSVTFAKSSSTAANFESDSDSLPIGVRAPEMMTMGEADMGCSSRWGYRCPCGGCRACRRSGACRAAGRRHVDHPAWETTGPFDRAEGPRSERRSVTTGVTRVHR